jgi:hypothetical protein
MVFIVIERNESVKTVESENKKSFHVGSNSFEHSFPRGPRAPRGSRKSLSSLAVVFLCVFFGVEKIRVMHVTRARNPWLHRSLVLVVSFPDWMRL